MLIQWADIRPGHILPPERLVKLLLRNMLYLQLPFFCYRYPSSLTPRFFNFIFYIIIIYILTQPKSKINNLYKIEIIFLIKNLKCADFFKFFSCKYFYYRLKYVIIIQHICDYCRNLKLRQAFRSER